MPSCSDSAECVTQTPVNTAVTEASKLSDKSENQELVSGLFFEITSDPDLARLIEAWPTLPEQIRTTINVLVDKHPSER